MKVRTIFTFSETELRTIRAAIGRGGVATRKEAVTFIDRAVRAAIEAAPAPKAKRMPVDADAIKQKVENGHARLYPTGCPMLCEACAARLGIVHETELQRTRRVRDSIARKFGHMTSGLGTCEVKDCGGTRHAGFRVCITHATGMAAASEVARG